MVRAEGHPGARMAAHAAVAAATAVFVVAVYGLVVVGGGGVTDSAAPSVPLAVLATAIVAITLDPVRQALRRRLLTSPHDLLTEFSSRLSAAVATDEVAPRMTRLIADATGARRVEVWLVRPLSPSGQELAARWPSGAEPIDPSEPRLQSHDVMHDGELLGRILRDQGDASPLTLLERRLIEDLVGQAGVALRTVALSAELEQRIAQTTARAVELRASRQRIVAASDAARRRLERDVHDGAQQHLVALAVNLSLAATVASRDPGRAAELIHDLRSASATALSTLEDLSRGIYPRLLAEAGLGVALRAAVNTSPVPVTVVDETEQRFPTDIEAAAYFGCLEAVQNAVKHAGAGKVVLSLRVRDGSLECAVSDDGSGFDRDALPAGTGLANMRDRVESLGGRLTVRTEIGAGTAVCARIPVAVSGG